MPSFPIRPQRVSTPPRAFSGLCVRVRACVPPSQAIYLSREDADKLERERKLSRHLAPCRVRTRQTCLCDCGGGLAVASQGRGPRAASPSPPAGSVLLPGLSRPLAAATSQRGSRSLRHRAVTNSSTAPRTGLPAGGGPPGAAPSEPRVRPAFPLVLPGLHASGTGRVL